MEENLSSAVESALRMHASLITSAKLYCLLIKSSLQQQINVINFLCAFWTIAHPGLCFAQGLRAGRHVMQGLGKTVECIAVLLHNPFSPAAQQPTAAAGSEDEPASHAAESVPAPEATTAAGTLIVTPPAIRRQWEQEVGTAIMLHMQHRGPEQNCHCTLALADCSCHAS